MKLIRIKTTDGSEATLPAAKIASVIPAVENGSRIKMDNGDVFLAKESNRVVRKLLSEGQSDDAE